MVNPILVEVTRGDRVESRHRGAVAACDADGRAVLAIGEIGEPIFPRSAVKPIQALPLVESGAADAFGFGNRELALAQASHAGTPTHVEGVRAMLAAAGLTEEALECGAHPPGDAEAAAELVRQGRPPGSVHNNCSGKHAGFLAVAKHLGLDHRGYVAAGHPVQEAVRAALEEMMGTPLGPNECGIDGCSIPTYALPLSALATGFARFGTGRGLSESRAAAAKRLRAAAAAEPFFLAGTGRLTTEATALADGAVLIKSGAEGVYCAAIPELGIGIALKGDDGAARAADTMIAAVLTMMMPRLADQLRPWRQRVLRTWRGAPAGEVRAVDAAFAATT
jgi:L-asparaginase II